MEQWDVPPECEGPSGLAGQSAVPEAELHRFHIEQWTRTLTEAAVIREDPEKMAAIRAYVRERRDELANLLDKL
jgi:hypothetical protein